MWWWGRERGQGWLARDTNELACMSDDFLILGGGVLLCTVYASSRPPLLHIGLLGAVDNLRRERVVNGVVLVFGVA